MTSTGVEIYKKNSDDPFDYEKIWSEVPENEPNRRIALYKSGLHYDLLLFHDASQTERKKVRHA